MTFNQFSKFGTPIHRNQIFNLNLKENFQSIKQFSKFGTPIHKNKNLNLKEGQLEFPIHEIHQLEVWNSYPQKTKFDSELERGST